MFYLGINIAKHKYYGYVIAQTPRNLGISYEMLHRWCNEYKPSKELALSNLETSN